MRGCRKKYGHLLEGGGFRGFLGKIRRFGGETREKGCLMSGAAARTGDLKRKEEVVFIKRKWQVD